MRDWKEMSLEELTGKIHNSIVDGPFGSNLKTSDYTESGVPVLQGLNITNDKFIWKDVRYISHKKAKDLYRSNAVEGDILSVKIGSVGYSAILETLNGFEYAIIPANLLRARVDNSIADTKFVYYLLTSINGKRKLLNIASNTAQPALSLTKFKSLVFDIPDISTQSTIVTILTTIDQAIEKTEQLIAKYERIKTGLMQDLLIRGIDEQGNIRSEETHEFKDSVLGKIPKEWEIEELQQFVEPNSPIVYGILMPGYGYDNGIPVIKVKDILNDKVSEEGLLLTSPEIAAAYERSKLEAGDLLFTIRGTVGRCAFVPKTLHGANITQDTARLRIRTINPKFVRLYFEMPFSKSYIELNTVGLAVKGINLRDLRKLLIAKPSKEESDRIVEKIDSLKSFTENEINTLMKLKYQKTALMQDLLTGKVRVDSLLGKK